jgi:hypothetical protein
MEPQFASFDANIGTYTEGTNITILIEGINSDGVHFYLQSEEIQVTSSGQPSGPPLDMTTIGIIIAIAGIVVVLGLVIRMRK